MSCDNCAEKLDELNAKLDYIINTVESTVGAIASHPMLKAMLPKGL